MSRYRLGIDIGGTFTDATLMDESTGEIRIAKVLTTPRDPSVGFMTVATEILRGASVSASDVGFLVHATTVATNAIIENKTARTAFITTAGFEDMMEIARQMRPSLYDLLFEKPPTLVPRYLCYGIRERLDYEGNVLEALDETAVLKVAEDLKERAIEAIAVCYLHSYINPTHERRTLELLRQVLPTTIISISADVAPEFREYFRATTTIINASIRPMVSHYLESIEQQIDAEGVAGELLIMQSNGGVYTSAAARERPVFMVESGPAAGAIAAAYLGTSLGHRQVISFDMGGTTTKACLIRDGEPRVTKDYEVGSMARGASGGRGLGHPIRTPVIDLVEIGAGGGSIAWVDSGGVLRVGPHSAGADPGPACYGGGGTQPTITDANLVLGRLDADYFLGGRMRLDATAAHRAIDECCAKPLGLSVVEAANGIIEIANSAMVNALRLVSIQRGFDPRDFVLVAFGGAGPVHANRLASANGIDTTLIPVSPGIFSSIGLLVTDVKRDYSVTLIRRLDQVDYKVLGATYAQLEAQGGRDLAEEGIATDAISFHRNLDMRYIGQSYELTIPLPNGGLGAAEMNAAALQFHKEHDRAYGFNAPAEPVEFVTLRLTAVGQIEKPALRRLPETGRETEGAIRTKRQVYFQESVGYVECPVYDRYRLGPQAAVMGPAIIEEFDSTTVLHPGYQATVDEFGNLLLTAGSDAKKAVATPAPLFAEKEY